MVIKHNPDVLKTADLIVDLSTKRGGDKGGEIIVKGTPQLLSRVLRSPTGCFLLKLLVKRHRLAWSL